MTGTENKPPPPPNADRMLSELGKLITSARRSRPIAYLNATDHQTMDELLGRASNAIGEDPIAPARMRGTDKMRVAIERMVAVNAAEPLASLRANVLKIVDILENMPDGFGRTWKRLEPPEGVTAEAYGLQYGNGPVNIDIRKVAAGKDPIDAVMACLDFPSTVIISAHNDQPESVLDRVRALVESELGAKAMDDRGNMVLLPIAEGRQRGPVKLATFLRDKTAGLLVVNGKPQDIVAGRGRPVSAEIIARSLGTPTPNPRAMMTLGLCFPMVASAGLPGNDFCVYTANNVDGLPAPT
jgi:hypothetical protein